MKALLILILIVTGFSVTAGKPKPTDKKATKETVKLYQNLIKLQQEKLMFGHQDALAYGHDWVYEEGRSDIKDVCGDYPAVYGWEIGHLELGDAYSLDSVHFDKIQNWIIQVYERGGLNTISWHLRNPYTGGSSWDTSSKKVVQSILPGGEKHDLFLQYLDHLKEFLKGCKTDDGTFVPILFRPFHEHTGSWFWWGKNLCSVEDYKALWRFTVSYLQDEKNIHHLLYSYSTDRFKTMDEYLERYPGDDIVDVIAFDLYDRGPDYFASLANCADKVSSYAKEKGKISTVSETGGPIEKNTEWWTQVLETLKPYNLSYVLVWRNPHKPTDHGAFAPHIGNASSENFVKFYNDSHTIFQKEISKEKIYK